MDLKKQLERQVKEKCENRIVKVILERTRIQVSGSGESGQKVTKSNEACSSPQIILENQNERLWDARRGSSESSPVPVSSRPQRNQTKIYTHYFDTGSDIDEDSSNIGSNTSISDLEPNDTTCSKPESAFLSKTDRVIKNLKTTSTDLDLDIRNKIYQNNDHSLTAKKLKVAKSYSKIACSICNLIISKGRMGRHFKSKHPEDLLQCDLCPYKCNAQRWLQRHILEVHVVDKPFECEICLKSFMTKKVLTKHKRSHGDKSLSYLSCNLCFAKSFKDSASLKKHVEKLHRRYIKHFDSEDTCNNLLCPVCDTWFSTDVDFAQHLKIPTTSKSVMKCKLCSEMVHTPCLLNLHRQKIHSDTPNTETSIERAQLKTKTTLKSSTKKQHPHSEKITEISESVKNQVSSNTFSCIVCSTLFSCRSDLDLHELREKHRRWKCSICAKLLNRREYLKRHIQIMHSDVRPFRCTYKGCSKSFKEKRVLKIHLMMHDADQDRIKCEVCSKMFGTRKTLKQHLLTHTDERPWPCKFCGKMFKCLREATRHMKKCQVRSEDQRKQFARRSNAAFQGSQKRKGRKIISCSSKESTSQTVKLCKPLTLELEPKAISTNTLTCATTSCNNENGTNLKLIKEEVDIKYLDEDLIIYQVPRLEGSVVKFEMVPKKEV